MDPGLAVIIDGRGRHLHLHHLSIQPQDLYFPEVQALSRSDPPFDDCLGVGVDQVQDALPDDFLGGRGPEELEAGLIGIEITPPGMHQDGVRGQFHQGAVAGLAFFQGRLGCFPGGDVMIDLQDGQGPPRVVPFQAPAAVHGHAAAVPGGVDELSFPMAGLEHQGFNTLQGLGKLGGEELVRHLGHGLAALPAIEFFGPPVPIGDAAPEIPDQ